MSKNSKYYFIFQTKCVILDNFAGQEVITWSLRKQYLDAYFTSIKWAMKYKPHFEILSTVMSEYEPFQNISNTIHTSNNETKTEKNALNVKKAR